MERLTRRAKIGEVVPYIDLSYESEYNDWVIDITEKLAEYEDLEEQGLLLRLPCKVGDTVWIITQVFNGINTVWAIGNRIIDHVGGNRLNPVYMVSKEPYELRFHPSQFGKTVFLTEEEAEARLKELEGSEEEL
jgi:hypothetical protein